MIDNRSPAPGSEPTRTFDQRGQRVGAQINVAGDYIGYSAEEVRSLIAEIRRADQPQVWDGRRPYLGLASFQEGDAAFFFGRAELVGKLLARVAHSRFVCVAGPSGSGKSSLVQAGLLPELRRGQVPGSDKWLLGGLTPLGDPVEQLALALARLARTPDAAAYVRAHGRTNPHVLHEQLDSLLGADPQQRAVLFVDQFEELFTQTQDPSLRSAFVALLTSAAQRPNGRAVVLLGLRSDFISQCAAHPDLRALISQEFQLVGAMDPAELAMAVTLPALEVGVAMDPELVSRIIADVKGEPGALPLMQFALQDLFDAVVTRPGLPYRLTLEQYLERGGLDQALERHADGVLAQLSQRGPECDAAARRIFAAVVEAGPGRADTRRTALVSDLASNGTPLAVLDAAVDLLSGQRARLITASEASPADGAANRSRTVTLAHEKLIDAWPWLRRLVADHRQTIALQSQVAADAATWRAKGEDESYLYRGGRLQTCLERLQAGALSLGEQARAFLEAAVARQRAEEQTELERERALTHAERSARQQAERSRNLLRSLVGVLSVALVLAVVAGVFLIQRLQTYRGTRLLAEAYERKAALDADGAIAALQAAVQADPGLGLDLPAEIAAVRRQVASTLTMQGEDLLRTARDSGDESTWQAAMVSASGLFSRSLALQPPSDTPVYVWILASDEAETAAPGYWIQRVEVSNRQYGRCVAAADGPCSAPANERWHLPEFARQPVTDISWQQAEAYAAWVGGRLPTESEWRAACGGADSLVYPWGDAAPDPTRLNFAESGLGTAREVGSYAPGANGLFDMAGNVWEWSDDLFAEEEFTELFPAKPGGEGGKEQPAPAATVDRRITRGGSYYSLPAQVSCTFRNGELSSSHHPEIGVRVVSLASAPPH